ncbi:MAG: hypothetical protein QY316_00620 [Thermodesulfobacteriota bacterium]|nr:MAG: hypothetical protein QY316_00620 [Thermodesulfobacteriota bacterium]
MECKSFPKTEPRQRLLQSLFAKARQYGIESDELRERIAPSVIGKRLSEASSKELFKVLDHVTKIYMQSGYQKFDSSKTGLLLELEAAARARWGEEFKKPLLAFINSHGLKGAYTHYRFMKVAELKAFKERIKELNKKEGEHGI